MCDLQRLCENSNTTILKKDITIVTSCTAPNPKTCPGNLFKQMVQTFRMFWTSELFDLPYLPILLYGINFLWSKCLIETLGLSLQSFRFFTFSVFQFSSFPFYTSHFLGFDRSFPEFECCEFPSKVQIKLARHQVRNLGLGNANGYRLNI